ncbi:MAG: polysaccharide deacetylase [Pseudohongiella sp.]|nr:MAG: polysaccharide deacetylase [Pseudohongiella sp.]
MHGSLLLLSQWLLLALLPGNLNAADNGVILAYHHVATDTPPSTSISPADFKAHLDYLTANDFNVMALDEMLGPLRRGEEIPEKSIALTFDDGYTSIYTTAFPMLQEYGFPFTLFLSTQPIDDGQANYMSWENIREMSQAGVIIANHMVEHPYMLDRENRSDEDWIVDLQAELLKAEQTIERETGQQHRLLAYPYGEYDDQIKTMLAANGFIGLAQNSGALSSQSDFLALPRFPLGSIYAALDTAKTKMAALAFNFSIDSPNSPVTSVRNPSVRIRFEPGPYNLEQIGCFANSKAIPMTWIDRQAGLLELSPEENYGGRRWRYICTAPDPGSTRYYWMSVQLIHP